MRGTAPGSVIAIAAAIGGVIGCGGEQRAEPGAATRPDAVLVGAVPDPFDGGGRQAAGTYVAKVGASGWTYVGLVIRGDRALVYLCDGRASEWFGAAVKDRRVLVRSARGTVVDARVAWKVVRGSVRPRGQAAGRFVAARPSRPGTGLFAGPDPAVPGYARRWIVLEDGIRGVSDGTSNTMIVGEGTPTPSATRTPGTIADGTSNTIVIGEGTATATPSATRPAGTPAPAATIADGTSNTIVVGQQPVNGVAGGAGAPPARPAPAVTTCAKGAPCPPAPPKPASTPPPVATAPDGKESFVAGGSFLSCAALELLRKSVAAAAKLDAAARDQLARLTAQAKANGC